MRRRCKIRLCPILPEKMGSVRIKRSLPLIFHLSMKRICAAHGITNQWTSARCTLHLEHCSLHLLIAHCSLFIAHCSLHVACCTLQLLGAPRSLQIARCSTKWALEQLWAAMKALLHLAKCCFRRERQDQYLRPTNDQPTTNGDQALAATHHISQSACPIYQHHYQHLQKPHTRQLQNIKLGMI